MNIDKHQVEKGVFTVVNNNPKYLAFAFALARSYRYHNSLDIPFFIVSDSDFELPRDLKWVPKKIVPKELTGKGLEVKLSLDKLAPAKKSLFIDADSLIYRDISAQFNLSNDSIDVIGTKITDGDWDEMQVPEVLEKFKVPYLIRYCGALYFLTKSDLSYTICEQVRTLAKSGHLFQKHTHGVNEEPIFSISMASAGIDPIKDTGNIWGDVHQLKSHRDLDVLEGRSYFNNVKSNVNYKFWLPEGDYSPSIIHFGGGGYNKNPWLFDAARLKLYYKLGLGKYLSNLLTSLFIKGPYFTMKRINSLRR